MSETKGKKTGTDRRTRDDKNLAKRGNLIQTFGFLSEGIGISHQGSRRYGKNDFFSLISCINISFLESSRSTRENITEEVLSVPKIAKQAVSKENEAESEQTLSSLIGDEDFKDFREEENSVKPVQIKGCKIFFFSCYAS